MKRKFFKSYFFACLATFLIPVLLVFQAFQSYRYKKLSAEIKTLEKKQVELVEQNRKLISDISVLSSSERIEKIRCEYHWSGSENRCNSEVQWPGKEIWL